MRALEWHDLAERKSSWRVGPWTAEPDRLQWPDAATGLPCLIVRHPEWGTLCGYVAVPAGHPLHGRDYLGLEAPVHWGLTFAGRCEGRVCHVVEGEPDDVWWLGFDCAHAFDLYPHLPGLPAGMGGTYRDVAYVRGECATLAAWLKAYTPSSAERTADLPRPEDGGGRGLPPQGDQGPTS